MKGGRAWESEEREREARRRGRRLRVEEEEVWKILEGGEKKTRLFIKSGFPTLLLSPSYPAPPTHCRAFHIILINRNRQVAALIVQW